MTANKINIKPLPCPFCGTKPEVRAGDNISVAGLGCAFSVTIRCKSKRCVVAPYISTYAVFKKNVAELKRDTIELWNIRKS